MPRRDDFNKALTKNLAARVGNHCSNPGCRALTIGPHENASKTVNVGVAAHITAAVPGGPRYDATLTPEQRCSIENAIWMCQNCALLIDRDPTRFPATMLRLWKANAEEEARSKVGKPVSAPKYPSSGSTERKPPQSAQELLERYAQGERDFSGASLIGARLDGANLEGANLRGANLQGSSFGDTNFRNADLREAVLDDFNGVPSNLTGCWISLRDRWIGRWDIQKLLAWHSMGARIADLELLPEHERRLFEKTQSTFNINISGSNINALAIGESALATGNINSPQPLHSPVASHSAPFPLVAFGPSVLAEGKRVAATGNIWTIQVYRFLLGDTTALCQIDSSNYRYIVTSEPADGRALGASPVTWKTERNYIEVQVSVMPPHLKYPVSELGEVTTLDLEGTVRGAAAGAVFLQTWLGTPIGMSHDDFGCRVGEYLEHERLVSRLKDIISIEITRLMTIPQVNDLTSEVSLPFGFVDRVVAIHPRPEEADDDTIPVDLHVVFVGGEQWTGEIRVAKLPWRPPPPINMDDVHAMLKRAIKDFDRTK